MVSRATGFDFFTTFQLIIFQRSVTEIPVHGLSIKLVYKSMDTL
jgi:hypothetical protein